MLGKSPRVSIGMPVYNGAAFLRESLDSLLSQTYGDFELIISDNASTDETEPICRSYAAGDPRVRYQRQEENRGATWNFNHVFELARSEYFKWAAYDDLHHPTFLARCVEVLDRCPDVVWCHSRTTHVGPDGKPLPDPATRDVSYSAAGAAELPGPGSVRAGRPARLPTREAEHSHQRFRAVLLGDGGCIDVYGLMRREVVRKTMLLLPYYGTDKVFVAELGLWGRYREIPQTLFFLRVHPQASGCLRTAAEQQLFEDPNASPWFTFTRLQLLRGYARAILRADLTITERTRCFGVLLRYLFQVSKWKGVVIKTFRGMGTGGGYIEHLRASSQPQPSFPSKPSSPRQPPDNPRSSEPINNADSPILLK